MIVQNVGLIAADSSRTRAYLAAMLGRELLPACVIFLSGGVGATVRNFPPVPYFDNSKPALETIRAAGIPCEVVETDDINSPEVVAAVKASLVDVLIYSGSGGAILRQDMLSSGKRFLHVHPGLLPRFRGSTTVYYGLLVEGECGVSALFLDTDIDAGPVLATRIYPPPEDRSTIDHGYDPYIRSDLLVRVLEAYRQTGRFRADPQRDEPAETYYIMHPVLRHIAILSDRGGDPREPATTPIAVPVEASQLKRVAIEASAIVGRYWNSRVTVSHKADGSEITEADTAVNDFLHEALMRLLPGAGWLSEETKDDRQRLTNDWVWVVDPIDGTNEFVRGTPEFAISVGLVHQGSVVLGCVVNPASGEGGVGQVGGGVEFWGGLKQRPSETRLSAASASVSRTETNDGTVLPYLGLVGTPLIVGSVAYKLLRTAAGHDDMTFSVQHKSEWDICGGVALLEAAGKVYRRLDGEPLRFNQGSTRVTSGAVAGESVLVEIFLVDMEQLASSLGKSLASP